MHGNYLRINQPRENPWENLRFEWLSILWQIDLIVRVSNNTSHSIRDPDFL
jgi:hypothetical protein